MSLILMGAIFSSLGELSAKVSDEINREEWPAEGAVSFEFILSGDGEDSLGFDSAIGKCNVSGKFISTPFMDSHMFFSRNASGLNCGGGINFRLKPINGKEILFQLPLSRLHLNQKYFMIVNWSSERGEISVNLQGTPQGDLGHWRDGGEPVQLNLQGSLSLGDCLRLDQNRIFELSFDDLAIHEGCIDNAAAARLAEGRGLVPLRGEARTVYSGSLDLSGMKLNLLYEADFSSESDIIREGSLLEDGRRVTLPPKNAEWILEGDHVDLEHRDSGLLMTAGKPEDRHVGSWVLWLNREFPANCLIEYEFTPANDTEGLNIVFFAAHKPGGGSIFELDLPPRRGSFREYIVGAINSYHISPWATDGKTMRRTANMRKNAGFALVAVGNDCLAGNGVNPKKIRVLSIGGRVVLESNGTVALKYDDNGITHGAQHSKPGFIGIRFMAHTRSAVLHGLRVYSAEKISKN